MERFSIQPRGPFDLARQIEFFGSWLTLDGGKRVVVSMPIEGWRGSASVVLRQDDDAIVHGEVHGDNAVAEAAWQQTLASLSLDVDGSDWLAVGDRDPVLARLQKNYDAIRPVLFHSPFEAAVGLLLGHRTSVRQRAALMRRLAAQYGVAHTIDGQQFHAFPGPAELLDIHRIDGVEEEKLARVHGAAEAALEGTLDRSYLRSLTPANAVEQVSQLRGVGPFFAQGIVFRGAGVVSEPTTDENTRQSVQAGYELDALPSVADVRKFAQRWHPYEMWAAVLLHIFMRREKGGFLRPSTQRRGPR